MDPSVYDLYFGSRMALYKVKTNGIYNSGTCGLMRKTKCNQLGTIRKIIANTSDPSLISGHIHIVNFLHMLFKDRDSDLLRDDFYVNIKSSVCQTLALHSSNFK